MNAAAERKNMKRVCIVGCGNISGNHRNAINNTENAVLYAACDIDQKRLETAEKEWGVIGYNNFADAINDKNIDSIHICTPHYLHFEMIAAALAAGKQVVCEKPVTMTKEEFDRLLTNENAKKICVVFQNRLNQSVQALKNIVDANELGKIISMKAFLTWHRDKDYYNSARWRGKWATEGGGVLINQAIHTLDYFNYVAGGIESIKADMTNFSLSDVIEVEDTVCAYLKLKNDAKGIFFATNAYTKNSAPFVEIIFEKGEAIYINGKLFVNGEKCAEDKASQTGKKYWGSGHDLLIKNFYDKNNFFNIYDAENTMKSVFAIYESAKSGKEIRI